MVVPQKIDASKEEVQRLEIEFSSVWILAGKELAFCSCKFGVRTVINWNAKVLPKSLICVCFPSYRSQSRTLMPLMNCS